MPFGKYKDFQECVDDNQDKESPEGYCSWLHYNITGEWPSQKFMKKGGIKDMDKKIQSVEEKLEKNRVAVNDAFNSANIVEDVSCDIGIVSTFKDSIIVKDYKSNKLYEMNYTETEEGITFDEPHEVENVYVVKQILAANPNMAFKDVQNLIDTWDEWAGSYDACVSALEGKPGIDDPEALCAWLHYEAVGEWPGTKSIKSRIEQVELTGPIVFKNKKKRIVYAAVLVPGEKDYDGETVSKEKVEDSCHEFMELYQNVDYKHSFNNIGLPIEVYLTYSDRVVKALDGEELILPEGTWIMGSKITEEAFKEVEEGKLTGYSITGIMRAALKALKEKDIALALKSMEEKGVLLKALKKTLLKDLGPDWVPVSVSLVANPAVPKSKWFALKSKERKPLSAWDKIKEILSLKSVGKEGKIKEVTKENQIRTINIINKGGKKDMEITKEELKAMISTVVKEEIKATKQEVAAEVLPPVEELKDVVPAIEVVVGELAEIKADVTAAETTAGEEVPAVNEKVDAAIEELKGIVTQVEATIEAGKEKAGKESEDAKKVKKEKIVEPEKNEEVEALKGKVDVVTKGLEKIYKALGIVDSKAIKGQDEEEDAPAKKDFGNRDSFGRKVKKSE